MIGIVLLTLLVSAQDSKGMSDIEVLTVEQRRQIFGTNTSENLPPIKLVTLQRLNVDTARPFRKRPVNVLQYRLTMNGQDIVLTLKQDTEFLSPGCFVHRHRKDGIKDMYPCARHMLHCFYSGHGQAENEAWIVANACQGLKGMLFVSNTSYVIAPLHPKAISNHDNDTHIHVVYRYMSGKRVCRTPEAPHVSSLHIVHRGMRDVPHTKYIDARVVVDPSVYEFHLQETENYILTLFSIASRAFEDRSIQEVIRLVLTEIHVFDSYDEIDLELTLDGNKTLTEFCKWIANNMTVTTPDCNVLLTRMDIAMGADKSLVGLAEPSAMCQTGSNCVIVEDHGPVSGNVIAHEIGHLLGMEHDENTACSNATGIMTKGVMGGNQHTWTSCSAKALHDFLAKPNAKCLLDEPIGLNKIMGINKGRSLPGTLFTRDQQCKLMFGKEALYCKEIVERNITTLCKDMICRKNKDARCVYSTQFADGTDCNNTRTWCISGECVAMNHNNSVYPIHGNWSDWAPDFSPCSRTCGGGVKIMRRSCTNPPPQFGGEFCLGISLEAVMCNMQPCKDDFKETQCSTLNTKSVNAVYFTWVPLDISSGNASCLFKCVGTGGNVTRLQNTTSPYIDGTECSLGPDVPFGRCIDGYCRAFGCDGVMDSGMVYDKCGVCNGTDTSCQEINGNYSTLSIVRNFTTIQVIPKGSYGITIRQFSKYSFLSIVINGQRAFNDDPRHRPSGSYVLDDIQIKYNALPERVEISGVTTRDIVVQVYNFYVSKPPKVQYVYYRPVDQRILQYTWATRERACSKSCGTGTTTPLVQCVDYYGPVDDYLCDLSQKPSELSRPCNDFYCPPAWKTSDFDPCTKTCGPGGTRSRRVYCAQEKNGTEKVVPSIICHTDGTARPTNIVSCTVAPCWGVWKSGPWSRCSRTCGTGYQLRTTKCFQDINSSIPIEEKFCKHTRPVDSQSCIDRYCYGYYGCTDNRTNCAAYGNDVCYGKYRAWAEMYCTKFCGICTLADDTNCSRQALGGQDVCTANPEWSKLHCPRYCAKTACTDALQCEDYRATMGNICNMDAFKDYTRKSCRKMCNLCTNGACKDQQKCSSYAKRYCVEPVYASFMKTNCPKSCGYC